MPFTEKVRLFFAAHFVAVMIVSAVYSALSFAWSWRVERRIARLKKAMEKHAEKIAYLQFDEHEKTPTSHFPRAVRGFDPDYIPPPPKAPSMDEADRLIAKLRIASGVRR